MEIAINGTPEKGGVEVLIRLDDKIDLNQEARICLRAVEASAARLLTCRFSI